MAYSQSDNPHQCYHPVYYCLFFQVEFSYPPIIPGAGHDNNTLPEEWKYLPFLALPDGAHNHQEGKVSIYTLQKIKRFFQLNTLKKMHHIFLIGHCIMKSADMSVIGYVAQSSNML